MGITDIFSQKGEEYLREIKGRCDPPVDRTGRNPAEVAEPVLTEIGRG